MQKRHADITVLVFSLIALLDTFVPLSKLAVVNRTVSVPIYVASVAKYFPLTYVLYVLPLISVTISIVALYGKDIKEKIWYAVVGLTGIIVSIVSFVEIGNSVQQAQNMVGLIGMSLSNNFTLFGISLPFTYLAVLIVGGLNLLNPHAEEETETNQ